MNLQSQIPSPIESDAKALDLIREAIGEDHVKFDQETTEFYSMDLMFADKVAQAIVAPGTQEELSEVVRIAYEHDLPIVPRGGGMSYTRGYVPTRERSIVVDMRRINRIVEINETDLFITVEAGCTWEQVHEALKDTDLRTPYWGPVSGVHATVGGALSQGSMFFGSATYGPVAESVLSVTAVIAEGKMISTGSKANRGKVPFHRYFGPDFTGLFLTDTGSMGLKAEASLRLIRRPKAFAVASFGFDNFVDLYEAQAELARHRLASECFALDPFLGGKRTNLKSWTEGANIVKNVAKSGGLKAVVGLVKGGTDFIEEYDYSMHLTVEGLDDEDCQKRLKLINGICLQKGGRIEPTVPQVLRAQPFQHVGGYLLGENGKRWVPIHANLPISKIPVAYEKTAQYFLDHKDVLEEHEIETGFSTSIAGTDMIFEPQFFWPDEVTAFHKGMMKPEDVKAYVDNPAGPAANDAVQKIMRDLTDIYLELGAVHQQLGKFYRYKDALDPVNWDLLTEFKRSVDPKGLINPDALGLGS